MKRNHDYKIEAEVIQKESGVDYKVISVGDDRGFETISRIYASGENWTKHVQNKALVTVAEKDGGSFEVTIHRPNTGEPTTFSMTLCEFADLRLLMEVVHRTYKLRGGIGYFSPNKIVNAKITRKLK